MHFMIFIYMQYDLYGIHTPYSSYSFEWTSPLPLPFFARTGWGRGGGANGGSEGVNNNPELRNNRRDKKMHSVHGIRTP
jgi:hypothetical protein